MNLLIAFIMCFLMNMYIVRKLRKVEKLSPILSGKARYFTICAVFSLMIALFRSTLLGFATYVMIFYLSLDLIGFIIKIVNKHWYQGYQKNYRHGIVIIIISVAITVLSLAHVKNIYIEKYTIDLDKNFASDSVRIMLVTDLHFGTATNESTLDKITETIQENQPDYLVLGGDIFDESTSNQKLNNAIDYFGELTKDVNVIYILGNHEHMVRNRNQLADRMKKAGVTVLQDEVMFTDEGFYFVGRLDKSQSMRSGNDRASLATLAKEIDFNYPVVLLDHQPVEMKIAKELGYDIVLSGHTHAGQFFPMTFFARFFNERFYGLYQEDNFYTIVSSGIGVWGMAIRNTSNSEIVILDIK